MYGQLFPTSILLLAIFAASACTYIIYQYVFSPLAAFPGPLAAKFTKIWRAYGMYKGTWHRDIVDLHRKYGPVVRIGPNELSVGDPEAFRQIYRVSKAFPKGACYSVNQGTRPFDLANERNEKIHAAQRRLVARPYSTESTKRFEPQIDVLLDTLLHKLDGFAKSSQTFDLGFWIQLYAFDMDSAAWLMHAPWFFKLHQNVIMPIFGNWLALNDRHGYFFQFSKDEVEKRKGKPGKDIAGQLFQAQAAGGQPNDLAITFMMTTNVFAGSDTTAIAMRAIFLNLLQNPQMLAKLRNDLQEQCSGSSDSIFSSTAAESSTYLQAVIYEGLRIFPSVAFVLDRDVPPEGMTITGKYIPGGIVVGTSPWVIHRAREIWGSDADEFRPERWLDKERVGELRRFFFAFGGGTRTCIGRHISWLEMEKLIAALVMRYDFELADDANITEKCGALVFLKGLRVKISPRRTN
ncbi:cytochrome P450 family protein [Xylaria digitata]|nr:cytochrome P450 family protein [Xylaria digitata]